MTCRLSRSEENYVHTAHWSVQVLLSRWKVNRCGKLGAGGSCLLSWLIESLKSRRAWFQASPGLKKKVCENPLSMEKNLGIVTYACHPSYRKQCKIGSWSRLAWAKSKTLSPERDSGIIQVIELLPWQVQSPEFKPQYHKKWGSSVKSRLFEGVEILV
jgi:hypothetical protein